MFGRILMTLGLAMLLAAPAHAGFGLVLPDSPIVDDPEKTSLNLVICAIDPATGAGIPIERPQVFMALRYSGDNMDRSEHLSVLDEVVAYGARAWTTNISLPHPGVYQLVMQTKAGWVPEQDKFVQYVTKVQIPAYGSAEGERGYGDTGGASRFFFIAREDNEPCPASVPGVPLDELGSRFTYVAKAPTSERPRYNKSVLRLRADLTPKQVDHVRARLTEAGVQVD